MSKIRIVNEHNEGIVGILEKKQDNGQKKPRLVLIAHGILGNKSIRLLFAKPNMAIDRTQGLSFSTFFGSKSSSFFFSFRFPR